MRFCFFSTLLAYFSILIIGSCQKSPEEKSAKTLLDNSNKIESQWEFLSSKENNFWHNISTRDDKCYGSVIGGNYGIYCPKSTLAQLNGEPPDLTLVSFNYKSTLVWVVHVKKRKSRRGPASTTFEICQGIAIDKEKNIYCSGKSETDLRDSFIMKQSPSGDLLWKTFLEKTDSFDSCNTIAVDFKNNVYCTGSSSKHQVEQIELVKELTVIKLNSKGKIQWVTKIGSDESKWNLNSEYAAPTYCSAMVTDRKSNIYCAGPSRMSESKKEGTLMKLDSTGKILWISKIVSKENRTLGDGKRTSNTRTCDSLNIDHLNNIYCAGFSSSKKECAFITKISPSGKNFWTRTLDLVNDNRMMPPPNKVIKGCYSITIDHLGNIFCASLTRSESKEVNFISREVLIIKLNPDGELSWIKQLVKQENVNVKKTKRAKPYASCVGIASDVIGNTFCVGKEI